MASALSACGWNTSGAPNRTRHVREAGMVGGEEHGPARKRLAGLLDDDAERHAGAGDQAERGTQDVPEQPGSPSLGQGPARAEPFPCGGLPHESRLSSRNAFSRRGISAFRWAKASCCSRSARV